MKNISPGPFVADRLRDKKKSKPSRKRGEETLSSILPHQDIFNLIPSRNHHRLFSQTLLLIPKHVFQKFEYRHKAGRSSRRSGFKERFTATAFIHLAERRSMRDGLRCLTAARTYGSRIAMALELLNGSIVLFGKNYVSYSRFRLFGEKGVFFVSRLKQNAEYKLLERRPADRKSGVTSGLHHLSRKQRQNHAPAPHQLPVAATRQQPLYGKPWFL